MNFKIRSEVITDTATLVLLLGLFTVQLPATIAGSYLIALALVLSKGSRLRFRQGDFIAFLLLLAIFTIPALTFNHGGTPLFYLFISPFLALLAYDFSKNSIDHIRIVLRNTYWIFIIFIGYALAHHWDKPEPLGSILPWASTNGIPSYLIVVQIGYSIAYYLQFNRLPLLSASTTFAISIFGLGRGSIIVAFLILFISLFGNILLLKAKQDRLILLKLVLIGFAPLIFVFYYSSQEIFEAMGAAFDGSKFASGVLDEHRGRILSDYLGKLDAASLLFGTSYDQTSINQLYGGNPHSSLIRAHSFYGLLALCVVFLPVLIVVQSKRDSIQKLISTLLILLVLIRSTSEPIFFPSTLDFFYYLYFLIFFRFSKKRTQKVQGRYSDANFDICKIP